MINNDLIWLSYDDAAARLGIKPDSVRRRAASRKWQRRIGNDGKASVGIPKEIIPDVIPDFIPDVIPDFIPDVIPDFMPDITPGNPDNAIELAAAKIEVRMLREQLIETKSDRDAWRSQAERLSEARAGGIWSWFKGQ